MSEVPSSPPEYYSYFEDEIDLRQYVEVLVEHWWVIIGLALVAAIAAFVFGSLGPDMYTSEADVSLLNIRSEIVFDPQFTTLPENEGQSVRRDALQALATSRSLLAEAYENVVSDLPSNEQSFETFTERVTVTPAGDLLRLKVTWEDPEVAAMIANEWASVYIQTANRSYVTTSSQTPEEARSTAADAFAEYEQVQEEYETFIADNDLDKVQREAGEVDELISSLQEQKTSALQLANTTPITAANQLAIATRDTLLNELTVSAQRGPQDRIRQLNDLYDRKATLERLQFQLQDLRDQLDAGTTSSAAAAGDVLAVMLARAGLTGESNNRNLTTVEQGNETESQPNIVLPQTTAPQLALQIELAQLAENSGDLTPADIESVLNIVEQSLQDTEREISTLTETIYSGTESEIPTEIPSEHRLFQVVQSQVDAMLNTEIALAPDATATQNLALSQTLDRLSEHRQQLRAQIEKLQAQERELQRQRDSAWELYKTLDNKAREVEAQFATGSPQVRLSVPARPTQVEDARGRLRLSLIAAVLGAMIGVFFALMRAFLQSSPEATDAPAHQEPEPARSG